MVASGFGVGVVAVEVRRRRASAFGVGVRLTEALEEEAAECGDGGGNQGGILFDQGPDCEVDAGEGEVLAEGDGGGFDCADDARDAGTVIEVNGDLEGIQHRKTDKIPRPIKQPITTLERSFSFRFQRM